MIKISLSLYNDRHNIDDVIGTLLVLNLLVDCIFDLYWPLTIGLNHLPLQFFVEN